MLRVNENVLRPPAFDAVRECLRAAMRLRATASLESVRRAAEFGLRHGLLVAASFGRQQVGVSGEPWRRMG
jgi:hypothetical protein